MKSVGIVLEQYGGRLLEGKYAVIPLVKLGQMLQQARMSGKQDASTSVRQYAKRYEVLRDLRAHSIDRQPLKVDPLGNVKVLQGDLLDKFLDEGEW